MFARRFLMITLPLLGSAACSAFRSNPAVQVSAEDSTLNSRWHANLASPATLAGAVQMNGSASMAPGPNGTSTHITVNLANASPGGIHPWEARQGQCGTGMNKEVLGPSAAYQPLEVKSDGRATGTATVSLPTPTTGNYFVVIRASAGNAETVVACGNLAPPTQ